VIGGKTGGIKIQVIHDVTGFLAASPRTAAHYAVYLLREKRLREEMGAAGREHVRRNFLITHQLRRYLMAIAYVAKRAMWSADDVARSSPRRSTETQTRRSQQPST